MNQVPAGLVSVVLERNLENSNTEMEIERREETGSEA